MFQTRSCKILDFSAFQLFFMSLSITAVVFGILYLFVGGRHYVTLEASTYERPPSQPPQAKPDYNPKVVITTSVPAPTRVVTRNQAVGWKEDTAATIDLADLEVSYRVIKSRNVS